MNWLSIFNSESEEGYWEIVNFLDKKSVTIIFVPESNYSDKDIKINISHDQFDDLIRFINRISNYEKSN